MAALPDALIRLKRAIPRFEFGREEETRAAMSPVSTYYLVVVPALVLTVFGLLMGFSAQAVTAIAAGENPYIAYLRPLIIIVAAAVIAAFVHAAPVGVFKRLAWPAFLLAMMLQVLVITPLGRSEGGNANWVHIPGLPVLLQPSEFLKLALVLVLAKSLTHPGARLSDWRQMAVKAGGLTALAILFVLLGRDMGTSMIVVAAALGALWVAGLPKRWFLVLGIAMVPVGTALVFSNPTRLRRVLAILPGGSSRDLSAPEQIDHSLWAFGSGGLSGLGPGASREKWNYLQAAHTDFIFAIVGEEFGLLGTLAVIIALGLLVWGMLRVVQSSDDLFVQIVSGGVASWIGIQAVVNIFSVTGIGPVIGVPLPLVSYGGSSFLFTAIAIGVVASFARAEAGMTLWGRFDAATRRRDPRIEPKPRRV
ncbi:FtsW/RodA/SpoVE family cell cycle protein [Schaalia hyovaginalis]|uniref:FtsW/RodA/SpoVE family cell cycle protein n=1 Tax=Schaalia hyovaginalis TaxID=29316 RepID=UPI002A80F3E4|nr:FtsW/RodA/SpoVE family cell cycle protein [Schaalia hyovaginalis]MDY3664574.1 FtsW/RodA/SpoVE family cell cycle protein [Schaalia hyovaginalis]